LRGRRWGAAAGEAPRFCGGDGGGALQPPAAAAATGESGDAFTVPPLPGVGGDAFLVPPFSGGSAGAEGEGARATAAVLSAGAAGGQWVVGLPTSPPAGGGGAFFSGAFFAPLPLPAATTPARTPGTGFRTYAGTAGGAPPPPAAVAAAAKALLSTSFTQRPGLSLSGAFSSPPTARGGGGEGEGGTPSTHLQSPGAAEWGAAGRGARGGRWAFTAAAAAARGGRAPPPSPSFGGAGTLQPHVHLPLRLLRTPTSAGGAAAVAAIGAVTKSGGAAVGATQPAQQTAAASAPLEVKEATVAPLEEEAI
jgi:hypothetical protein